MPFYTDQLNRIIEIDENPKRIVSLVPSQTELLFDLGLDKEVIGITKFCIHPEEWFRNKKRVGGTKTVDIRKVELLDPDLIIANKEENTQEQVKALQKIAPVWISDIHTISGALQMIGNIGAITGKGEMARKMVEQIETDFQKLPSYANHIPYQKYRTAYLIWKDPYMAAGGGTFIHDMLGLNGLENVFADKERYPTIDCSELQKRDTQLLLLSSEPYPFKQQHIDELSLALPDTKIMIVDGEMFSWYGSRMILSGSYFQQFQQILTHVNV